MRIFYTKTATVYRLVNDTGSTIKEAYSATPNGTVLGALMSAQPADAMLSDGNPSKSAVWFCDPASDIKDADKLTIDNVSYVVKGVMKTEVGIMSINYKKVLIEKMAS